MNGAILNVLAICVAVVALVISSWFALRQVRYVRQANHLPLLAHMVQDFRNADFMRDIEYVEAGLAVEHDPKLGIANLPSPAKERVINVAYYFQALAAMVIFDVVDDEIVVYMMRYRVRKVWSAIEPFVLHEREYGHHKGPMLTFLEDLAVRCSEVSDEQADRRLGLRSFAKRVQAGTASAD
ncbi:hypothetical protein HH310_37525 [Actinoplanes sp. TBRC 11911]|uniref:DUF4760 domain-containing protein n=1 Tax=Actinoplanes sp. TBRC 11911 TaxID=2729386 RepID=UPI00145E71D6|nr:hypothetical protein [Actinoplanes sp. TBRC 11911]NMO56861.1 hypothetical protein [Actinoplanes sp. TBRC 11911]